MSIPITKEDVIQNKKSSIKSLNNMLERFINDSSEDHLKKANLISYWIKDYVKMINFEEKFDPTRNIAYKRGNIVKLNFGFNIGAEYGGLHYGVVLDMKNDRNSPVVTVIPLTSLKEGADIHKNSVDLGNDIYRMLKLKYDTISKTLKDEHNEIEQTLSLTSDLFSSANQAINEILHFEEASPEYKSKLVQIGDYLASARDVRISLAAKREHNLEQQEYLDKIGAEIQKMKEGSVALVNQITTISKIRIFDPRNLKGILSGISLSEENMEKINRKVQELYVFH